MNMLKINGRDLKILVAGRRGTLGNKDGKMEPGIGRERSGAGMQWMREGKTDM